MKNATRRPASLSDCLAAAQTDAERFHGLRPVQAWQPKRAWKAWALAAAGTVAALGLTAWLWDAAVAPVAQPMAAAMPRVPTAAPSLPPTQRATAPQDEAALLPPPPAPPAPTGNAVCDAAGCTVDPARQSPEARAAMLAMAQDADAWALAPEPILSVPAASAEPPQVGLMNVPPIPDEHDATPGDADEPEPLAEELAPAQ